MLSRQKTIEYNSKLTEINTYCKLIRLGSKNLETKIKQSDFQNQNNLIGIDVNLFIQEYNYRANSSTFLMLISEFERLLYIICISEGKRIKEDVQKEFSTEKFLDNFIIYKTKKDFYPLSSIKNIYSKISAIDLQYISELIDLRNFIAHGQKEKEDLGKSDINIIYDLDTITKKLCELLGKI